MTIRTNGALRLCLAGAALGWLTSFAFVPVATAQRLPPWRFAPPPGEIERSLEARGYVLTAPLMRRPGIYLADVTAGPGGYQRLVIDARSGRILERFLAPSRMRGPALAARRDEEFGEPPPSAVAPPLGPGFSGEPRGVPPAKSAYGGPVNAHIPSAISPYGPEGAPVGAKPKPKSVSTERKAPASKAPTANPPVPPPAPREAAKPSGSGSLASQPAEKPDSDRLKVDSRPTEVDNVPRAAAPTPSNTAAEANDKPKVSIVPQGLFE